MTPFLIAGCPWPTPLFQAPNSGQQVANYATDESRVADALEGLEGLRSSSRAGKLTGGAPRGCSFASDGRLRMVMA